MTEIAAGPGFALPRGVEPGRAVIVGAGPNGLTAAALLAERGHDVVLVEKERHPRFHIGESLLPRNTELLDHLGLTAAGAAPFT